jgi:hypothetical protein
MVAECPHEAARGCNTQCYGCIDHVHSMSIIIHSKHIMIIIYLEPCHSLQNCVLNCLNRLPMLMFE